MHEFNSHIFNLSLICLSYVPCFWYILRFKLLINQMTFIYYYFYPSKMVSTVIFSSFLGCMSCLFIVEVTCSSSSRKEDSNLVSTSAQFLCTHNSSGQFSELKIGKNWPQARIRASKQLNNKKLRQNSRL